MSVTKRGVQFVPSSTTAIALACAIGLAVLFVAGDVIGFARDGLRLFRGFVRSFAREAKNGFWPRGSDDTDPKSDRDPFIRKKSPWNP